MKPRVCNYYLTFRCEASCDFCAVWRNKELLSVPEVGFEQVKHNLIDLKKAGVLVMNFTGGDPILRDDISEILRFSKRQGFFNIITTSGEGFADKAEGIVPFTDHMVFSLDSPEKEGHNNMRGIGCYDSVIEGIKITKAMKKLPIINFTLNRENIQLLPEMVDLAKNLGVLLWINPVYNWGGIEGFEHHSLGYIARYFGDRNVALNLASLELIKHGGNDIKRPICKAGTSTITVFPDNTLAVPCFYFRHSVSDIGGNLLEALNKKEVRLSRSLQGRGDECRGCSAWPYINPSFMHGINKYSLLALYSIMKLFQKEIRLKKGVLK